MPKVLNVKKLEEKFQTLSRSRESIQGLAIWIMHHKEVYHEIVAQWLIGISNDCNTLAMFYVANEIIQGCGKKKCPEFREAFSKVLEEAVSFDHVKEFKDKILRLLSLWKERNLFADELYQSVENKLNDSEEQESSDEESEEEDEEELSELDIIQQFKKEILIDTVEKLKLIEFKRQENEDILNYADVPELPNLENISVRADCKDAMRKCDAYIKLVTNFTKLMGKEISMRKKILKELNKNCVFYTAQQKDVKEVANAFRIYGKRVKLLETRLGEKITTFSSPSYSPGFSDSTVSSNTGFSNETDDTSKNNLSPFNKSNQSFLGGASTSNDSFSFSGKVSSKLVTEIFGGIKQPEKNTEESKIPESVCSKETQSIEKENRTQSQSPLNVKEHAVTEFRADSGTPLEKEYANFIQCLQSKEVPEGQPSPYEKDSFSEKLSTKPVGKEISCHALEYQPEVILSKSNSSLPILQENAPELKENLDSNHKKYKTKENEDIDLLLEESFDKKSQTKLNFKRKIELLLQSNAKKHCSEQQTQEISEQEPTIKVAPLPNLKEKPDSKHANKKEDILNKPKDSKISETSGACNSKSTSKIVKSTEKLVSCKVDAVTKFKTSEIDIDSTSSLSESGKTKLFDKSPVASTCPYLHSSDQKQNLPFNTNATFTGTPMLTFVSSKSDIMSFEDAEQPEKDTLTLDPSATFTGINMSSIMSCLSANLHTKDTKQPDTKETFTSDLLKEMPMTSFMPKTSANVHADGAKQSENLSSNAPALSPIAKNTEVQQKADKDSFPRVPALSSFMFDMSTDLLKNILKINQQNTVTESNQKTSVIAQQSESISYDKEVIPLLSNAPHEESLRDSGKVSKADSRDTVQNFETISTSEKVATKSKDLLHNIPTELTSPSSDSVLKSVHLDETSSVLNVKETRDTLLFKDKQSVTSDNLRCSKGEALDTKPTLLKTLQTVLVCLSENMKSKCDFKISTVEKHIELEPPLPIESMLKIYNYVHGGNNYFSDNSVPSNISSKTSNCSMPSVVNVENNYEVMDMECDSEGEAT